MNSRGFIKLDGFVVPGRFFFFFGQGITSRGSVRASKLTERAFMCVGNWYIPSTFFLRAILTYLSH